MSCDQTISKEDVIAVLMGGPGSERGVSLASGKSVVEALTGAGYNAVPVDVTGRDVVLPEGTVVAVNVIHGTFGEDGELQRVMEGLGVPLTGAGVASSELAFDKVESKKAFVAAGVPTPACEILKPGERPQMSVPLVVKPAREGSSVGVHLVHDEAGLQPALDDAAKYGDEVLVEQMISGKELTVGVLDGRALPVVHICPRSGFYDMANKYPWMGGSGGTDYYCPADLTPEVTQRVQEAAVKAHQSLGIEVYSRVDVLLDADGNPWVLEANTIPGMTESSLLPKAARVDGLEFADLCLKIIELSIQKAG
ncbi:D-alanine--D-alanine ligase [Sulfuriroseicoccus oceanibius]|uniref:D-alanine--D-alanine ligase n=1 Tax=Sulfuriroseicoccus oceanibius TaxID=2707525 RepID=A0A6B3L632_9BACT|nr:D-alanine--D-alanine ligase [Sulfuriroseicoccus oceanibius]QQL46070.1 D-alanine--D-alanine ligase [Sulfuriroseicoccus oceanibius]